jgi:hypothetical protein
MVGLGFEVFALMSMKSLFWAVAQCLQNTSQQRRREVLGSCLVHPSFLFGLLIDPQDGVGWGGPGTRLLIIT